MNSDVTWLMQNPEKFFEQIRRKRAKTHQINAQSALASKDGKLIDILRREVGLNLFRNLIRNPYRFKVDPYAIERVLIDWLVYSELFSEQMYPELHKQIQELKKLADISRPIRARLILEYETGEVHVN